MSMDCSLPDEQPLGGDRHLPAKGLPPSQAGVSGGSPLLGWTCVLGENAWTGGLGWNQVLGSNAGLPSFLKHRRPDGWLRAPAQLCSTAAGCLLLQASSGLDLVNLVLLFPQHG